MLAAVMVVHGASDRCVMGGMWLAMCLTGDAGGGVGEI